jgi:hypothetical protein
MSSKKKWETKKAGNLLRAKCFIISLLNEGMVSSHMSLKKVTQCCQRKKSHSVIVQN